MTAAIMNRERPAQAYAKHPALLRMSLRELGENANARIYIGLEKYTQPEVLKEND